MSGMSRFHKFVASFEQDTPNRIIIIHIYPSSYPDLLIFLLHPTETMLQFAHF